MNQGTTKTLVAGAGGVAKRRIVMFGPDERTVVQATGATDYSIGVSTDIDAAVGERCDVYLSGIVPVQAAGVIQAGKFVTSDADGKAVEAAPGATQTHRVIGVAMQTAAVGDIIDVMINPGAMSNAANA